MSAAIHTVAAGTDPLLDPRTGIVVSMQRFTPAPEAPHGWGSWIAYLADTSRFGAFQADRYGYGAALDDSEAARLAALGEAVERYCGNAVPDGLRRATWDELTRARVAALDPDQLSLYSPRQYADPEFPFVPLRRDTPATWADGEEMHSGTTALVPAALTYLNYFTGSRRAEPWTNPVPYSGIAAGVDREHAEVAALEEVFERDATALWWASGAPAVRVRGFDESILNPRLDAHVLWVPSQFEVSVIACFLEDHRRGIVGFGSSCKADPERAVRKAIVEAYQAYLLASEIDDPGSALWAAIAREDFHAHTFRPHRADRGYRHEFRSDLRDIVDLPLLAQYYLDPAHQGAPLDRLRTHAAEIELRELPAAAPDRARAHYLETIAAQGMLAYSVDLTTTDVRAAGRRVVRALIPGTYGNSPAAYPFLGGTRLYRVPQRLGFTDRVLDDNDLYPYPIPLV
ncbi:YcaO-like family protein [Nocardia inohanensis]|uniref:YcaO-like family protein n=1 Tax=Nocardia inohanensis TaxID=209246 RepID=UPI000835EC7F|nr:YcaO-like family protein [Nocardia inohanensis]